MKNLPAITLLLFQLTTSAQPGSWNILTAKADLSEKWSSSLEGQIRSLRFYNYFHYFEYKAGIYYDISENFTVGSLAGHYRTYAENGSFSTPVQSDELRTCLQIVMKQNVHRFNFEHRYRIEQRFTSNGFRNRFRYRIGLMFPISAKGSMNDRWTFTIWNEIFMTNKAPYFERDRFFAGFGYKLNPHTSIQTGYIRQFDYNLTDETGRDFIQIGFQFEIGRKNKSGKTSVQIGD